MYTKKVFKKIKRKKERKKEERKASRQAIYLLVIDQVLQNGWSIQVPSEHNWSQSSPLLKPSSLFFLVLWISTCCWLKASPSNVIFRPSAPAWAVPWESWPSIVSTGVTWLSSFRQRQGHSHHFFFIDLSRSSGNSLNQVCLDKSFFISSVFFFFLLLVWVTCHEKVLTTESLS